MSFQIEKVLTQELQNSLKKLISKDNIQKIEDAQNASKWYKSAKDKDSFLSNAANMIIERFMENLPGPFSNLLFEGIKVNTSEKEPNVKFNASFTVGSLKPYIEFVKIVNGQATGSILKTVFQLDCSVVLSDVQIILKEDSKSINTGDLEINFELSIIKAGVLGIYYDHPKVLGERGFKINLSKNKLEL